MPQSILTARLILLLFAVVQGVLSWWLRFLPWPIKNQKMTSLVLAILWAALLVGEMMAYTAATGHVPLKNDNFFMVGFVAQQVVSAAIVLRGQSVRMKRETGVDWKLGQVCGLSPPPSFRVGATSHEKNRGAE
jgi:hypothetical protein